MLDKLTSEDFFPLIDQEFTIQAEASEPFKVKLITVTDLGSETPGSADPSGGREGRRPFSIVFRGQPDPVLPQRIYQIENQSLGSLSIFLVPIGPDQEGMLYEAVFN